MSVLLVLEPLQRLLPRGHCCIAIRYTCSAGVLQKPPCIPGMTDHAVTVFAQVLRDIGRNRANQRLVNEYNELLLRVSG
jgi:hypothetical protein